MFTVVPSQTALISLILLGVFASSFAYSLFAYVVKHLGISKGNVYTNLIAVFAAIASFIILKEEFSLFKLIGMFVIIIGVTFSQIEKKKSKKLIKPNENV